MDGLLKTIYVLIIFLAFAGGALLVSVIHSNEMIGMVCMKDGVTYEYVEMD